MKCKKPNERVARVILRLNQIKTTWEGDSLVVDFGSAHESLLAACYCDALEFLQAYHPELAL